LIAALAPAGVPNADIIVTDSIGDKLCAIQAKAGTKPGADKGWHMREKHEKIVSPNIYYCFVGFGTNPPGCWIVPSAIVADVLKRSYLHWLNTLGRGGEPHKPSNMRRFCESYDHNKFSSGFSMGWLDDFRDKWETLEAVTKS
jgi:hypothetical protein